MTPPSERHDYALNQTLHLLDVIETMIAAGDQGQTFGERMKAAERAITRLKSPGRPTTQIGKYERRLGELRTRAAAAEAKGVTGGDPRLKPGEKLPSATRLLAKFADGATQKAAKTCIEGLEKPGHWAHEAFEKEVIRVVEASGKIPEAYKATLCRDTAMLLRACPSAGGLVAAMQTRGQPRGSFARKLASTGNDAVGAAYEIMGTAALCSRPSSPANPRHAAPSLSIDPIRDNLVFGPKAYVNHRYAFDRFGDRRVSTTPRSTVEADAQLFQDGREIGIDFKHVKEAKTRGSDEDLRNQIKSVAEAISSGQYDEYHFVSNGRFSTPFKEQVEKVNDVLVAHGNKPIACHEYVSSIAHDPHTDGE